MISSGIVFFVLQGKTVLRAFTSFRRGGGTRETNLIDRIEVSNSGSIWGVLLSGVACIVILYYVVQTDL